MPVPGGMQITIVTLYDDNMAEIFVGAVEGEVSLEQKRELAASYNAVLDGEDGSHEEEGRTIGFRLVSPAPFPGDLRELTNAWAGGDPESREHS